MFLSTAFAWYYLASSNRRIIVTHTYSEPNTKCRIIFVRNKFLILDQSQQRFSLLLFCYKTRCYGQLSVPIGYTICCCFFLPFSIKKQNIINLLGIFRGKYMLFFLSWKIWCILSIWYCGPQIHEGETWDKIISYKLLII